MKPSPMRHPLAVLRKILGLGQKEMAQLIGKSRPTVQAIELGKLKPSELVCLKIAEETGVALSWIASGNPSLPPINGEGKPYQKDDYRAAQGGKIGHEGELKKQAIDLATMLYAAVSIYGNSPKDQRLLCHVLNDYIQDMEERLAKYARPGSRWFPNEKMTDQEKWLWSEARPYVLRLLENIPPATVKESTPAQQKTFHRKSPAKKIKASGKAPTASTSRKPRQEKR